MILLADQPKKRLVGSMNSSFGPSSVVSAEAPYLPNGGKPRKATWVGWIVLHCRVTVANDLITLHDFPSQVNTPFPSR